MPVVGMLDMKSNSKTIIVGAGPCGSFSAFNLAKKGVEVTVYEEHSEIGIPSHCAGHLSIKGLRDLGLYPLPAGILENAFSGALFFSPDGRQFEVRFASPVTCSVNRSLFDKHLAERAQEAGAIYILNSRIESLMVEDGFTRGVSFQENNQQKRVSSDIVIDAEGTSSRLLRQIGLPLLNVSMLLNGVEAEVENVKDTPADEVEVFLGKSYAPAFYAWLMPGIDGSAKVGLASKDGNSLELLEKLMKRHPVAAKQLRNARILKKAYHPITLGGPIPKLFENGFLVIGDAASQVKPTTGGGVILGMNCARIAAEVVSEAFKRNDFSAQLLKRYQTRCDEFYGLDMKLMLGIRKVLNRLSDRSLDDLLEFCNRFRVDKAFRDFDEIDLQAHGFLRSALDPRIFAVLAYLFMIYLSANP
jgi:digeranylgeranylglycerophospholipid reductase